MNTTPFASAAELARRISAGELSSRALVELYIARIERHDPSINAVVVRLFEQARARADEADRACARGERCGPLHGVPITIKECFDVQATASTFGHPERRDHRAHRNATAVERLVQAGAIVLGKTNVPKDLSDWQSHNALYGVTNNPWDITRTPGGSSGGASAALAAGFSALELGSDVGGSIRMPAHCCGVYGHKPTFGVVPLTGHSLTPHANPGDIQVAGPLARSALDLDIALRLIAGPDGAQARAWSLRLPEPKAAPLSSYRVAVITSDDQFPTDRDTQHVASSVADALKHDGAQVDLDPPLPMSSREYYELYVALLRGATSGRRSLAEIARFAAQAAATDPADHRYEAIMLRGLAQNHRQWIGHDDARQQLRVGWEAFFDRYDAVIAPIATTPAFTHEFNVPRHLHMLDIDGTPRPIADNYYWIGIAGTAYLPATAIPAGLSARGLPIGMQIIGREFADLTCIALARHLEQSYRGFVAPPGFG